MTQSAILTLVFFFILGVPVLAQEPSAFKTGLPPQVAATPHMKSRGSMALRDVLRREDEAPKQVSLKELIPNIARDQKPIWLSPFHLAEGKHLKPFLLVAAVTAGLVALDPHDEPYFRDTPVFDKFKTGPIRGRNMTFAVVSAPLALYLGGQLANDNYAMQSGLLATEALGDAMIADYALKSVFGRLHPSDIPVHGDFTHTWFKYPAPFSSNPGSFPSGHSAMAFAVASVLSRRYHRHRWVPWVVYGAATIVALTRIPDRAHFASDVFAGAALGFAIGHFVTIPRPQTGQP